MGDAPPIGLGQRIGEGIVVADIGQPRLDAGGVARRRDVQIQSLLDRGEGSLRRIFQLLVGGHANASLRIAVRPREREGLSPEAISAAKTDLPV